ncbi:hypothetical protein AAVH_09800 [Aphelenchoides avenae]|nr:hypothetical protein AAVH_09800 [Aphelenchus avenae]
MDDRKEQTEATTAKVEFAHNLIKSAVTHAAARLRYTIKAVHGCSGRAMVIKDAVEKLPVLRLDYTYAGHNYAHWNVNWKLLWKVAKTHDPHLPASPMALHTGEASNRTAVLLEAKVGPALTATALIVDTARISHAAYSDYNAGSSVPTTTMKTTANVAGAYARGYGGAVTGGVVGAKVGAGVGWLFGPAGTLAGAAIGGVAGGIGGAVGGAFGGAFAAEKATEKAIDVATDADK